MFKAKIKLDSPDAAHQFVKLADACEFDVNVGYDKIVIDAKSIVGVMGLDLGRTLTVTFDGMSDPLRSFCESVTVG